MNATPRKRDLQPRPRIAYQTPLGQYIHGDSTRLLNSTLGDELAGKVDLIITSPPFPLNKKKKYGNLTGDEYREWFSGLAPLFAPLLSPKGSIVLELGNAWEPGRPVQSLLPLESLIAFAKHREAGLRVCQQFVCYNPSRLPSPAQWVTIKRERVTDSYTHVWWLSKNDHPKADNRRALRAYSAQMLELLRTQRFNAGERPNQAHISDKGFLTDNGGSIAHNFFELEGLDTKRPVRLPNAFSFSNTNSNDHFLKACRKAGIRPHPARMPAGLASFFVQFLSAPDDLVLDPFAGSNTTGYVAECLQRRWIGIEAQRDYVAQSKLRFDPAPASPK